MNLVPAQYREVSVAEVPVPLEDDALRAYLTGRAVYRRTRYIVARNGARQRAWPRSARSPSSRCSPR